MNTPGIDGTSQISVEEVESLLDFEDFFEGDVGGDVVVWIEAHISC